MRRTLDDVDNALGQELEVGLRVVFRGFEQSLASATQPWKKAGRVLKVFAYGEGLASFAAARAHANETINLLIVVNDERLTSYSDYWSPTQDQLRRERWIEQTLQCDFDLLVVSLTEINRGLESGEEFFSDIIANGIALYEDEGTTFAIPRHLPEKRARAAALAHFEFWYPRSVNARHLANCSINAGMLGDAAFLLHQAAERAYHCALLVGALHSPKTHRLELLRSNAEHTAPMLARAWVSTETKFARRCFDRVRRAYVAARYDPHYRITLEELLWIDERVAQLQDLVRIEKAIRMLPRLIRQVFNCVRLQAIEYEDISQRFGLSVEDVELYINEALDSIALDLRMSVTNDNNPNLQRAQRRDD